MPVIDLMWLVTTSSIMVFLADLQQIFEFFRAMTRNLGFKQQFLVNPTVSWLLWSMHGLNIEEFQSKKKKDWFPTVFGVLLLILLSTVPGKEYGLTKRLENVDVIRATPAIVILQTRKLLFDVHLFIRLLIYTYYILIYTPLLPEVQPQKFLLFPRLFSFEIQYGDLQIKTSKNIQFTAILDAYSFKMYFKVFLYRKKNQEYNRYHDKAVKYWLNFRRAPFVYSLFFLFG